MKLSELIKDLPVTMTDDFDVKGITADSRKVKKGYVFAALKGTQLDGHDFVSDALKSGAKAILTDQEIDDGTALMCENAAQIFAKIVARFYAPRPEFIVGVTGTNGKTSTSVFIRQIWANMGLRAANIGTIGTQVQKLDIFEEVTAPGLTSLDPVALHELLKGLKKDRDIDHVALEASSHGLDQYRLDGLTFDVGVFTNFTHDHLDYHKTEQAYFDAKMRLFAELIREEGVAVLNADIPQFSEIKKICEARDLRIMDYGFNAEEFKIIKKEPGLVTLQVRGEVYEVPFNLMGDFQLYNGLAAIATIAASGVVLQDVLAYLSQLTSVPGRMENIPGHPHDARILVDYAHTPDALENVLKTAKPYVKNKLHVVFGCGGDRDNSKRKIMGQIAAKYADEIYVTDDNPRTEDPGKIRDMVMEGCPDAQNIADRKDAIFNAVKALTAGDILVVAGKGHEDYQIIGTEKQHFDDREVVQDALDTL